MAGPSASACSSSCPTGVDTPNCSSRSNCTTCCRNTLVATNRAPSTYIVSTSSGSRIPSTFNTTSDSRTSYACETSRIYISSNTTCIAKVANHAPTHATAQTTAQTNTSCTSQSVFNIIYNTIHNCVKDRNTANDRVDNSTGYHHSHHSWVPQHRQGRTLL